MEEICRNMHIIAPRIRSFIIYIDPLSERIDELSYHFDFLFSRIDEVFPFLDSFEPSLLPLVFEKLIPRLEQLIPYIDALVSYFEVFAPHVETLLEHADVLVPRLGDLVQYFDHIMPHLDVLVRNSDAVARHADTLLEHLPDILPYMGELMNHADGLADSADIIVPRIDALLPYLPELVPRIGELLPYTELVVDNFGILLPYIRGLIPRTTRMMERASLLVGAAHIESQSGRVIRLARRLGKGKVKQIDESLDEEPIDVGQEDGVDEESLKKVLQEFQSARSPAPGSTPAPGDVLPPVSLEMKMQLSPVESVRTPRWLEDPTLVEEKRLKRSAHPSFDAAAPVPARFFSEEMPDLVSTDDVQDVGNVISDPSSRTIEIETESLQRRHVTIHEIGAGERDNGVRLCGEATKEDSIWISAPFSTSERQWLRRRRWFSRKEKKFRGKEAKASEADAEAEADAVLNRIESTLSADDQDECDVDETGSSAPMSSILEINDVSESVLTSSVTESETEDGYVTPPDAILIDEGPFAERRYLLEVLPPSRRELRRERSKEKQRVRKTVKERKLYERSNRTQLKEMQKDGTTGAVERMMAGEQTGWNEEGVGVGADFRSGSDGWLVLRADSCPPGTSLSSDVDGRASLGHDESEEMSCESDGNMESSVLVETTPQRPRRLASSRSTPLLSTVKSVTSTASVVLSKKKKLEKFRELFKIGDEEVPLHELTCALLRGAVLFQGVIYLSKSYFCFHFFLPGLSDFCIPLKDVLLLRLTSKLALRGILVVFQGRRFSFFMFNSRRDAFLTIQRAFIRCKVSQSSGSQSVIARLRMQEALDQLEDDALVNEDVQFEDLGAGTKSSEDSDGDDGEYILDSSEQGSTVQRGSARHARLSMANGEELPDKPSGAALNDMKQRQQLVWRKLKERQEMQEAMERNKAKIEKTLQAEHKDEQMYMEKLKKGVRKKLVEDNKKNSKRKN